MKLKNIKIDETTWKELSKQKIDLGFSKIAEVIRLNQKTIRLLKKVAKKGETYDKTIRRLIKNGIP